MIIDILITHKSAKYQHIRISNKKFMHYLIQSPSRIKYDKTLLICTHLGTFSAFHYIFYIFLRGYNSRTIQDIKFKFSEFLSFVEATNYVKFQSARCTSFKVDIFRIGPIGYSLKTVLYAFLVVLVLVRFRQLVKPHCLIIAKHAKCTINDNHAKF